jgi:hypothetical protein
MKKVVLSVFPNKVVRLVGVDVEFVLPCRSDPLGWHGDESENYLEDKQKMPIFAFELVTKNVIVCAYIQKEKERVILH